MHVEGPTTGRFAWHELGTTDDERAKSFYEQLFGWSITASELLDEEDAGEHEGMGTYWMVRHDGRDLAGAYRLPPPMLAQGVPPHWLSYVGVSDADAAAKKITDHGGQVVMGPMDVGPIGRMAMAQDPTGATFALWQGKSHGGHGVRDEVGAVCWNELLTPDPDRAAAFYRDVFGWSQSHMENAGPVDYRMLMNGDEMVAGLMEPPAEAGPVPPSWMVYFQVGDADETVARATELGATVCGPLQDIDTVGRMAVLRDPTGAVFAVIRLNES